MSSLLLPPLFYIISLVHVWLNKSEILIDGSPMGFIFLQYSSDLLAKPISFAFKGGVESDGILPPSLLSLVHAIIMALLGFFQWPPAVPPSTFSK